MRKKKKARIFKKSSLTYYKPRLVRNHLGRFKFFLEHGYYPYKSERRIRCKFYVLWSNLQGMHNVPDKYILNTLEPRDYDWDYMPPGRVFDRKKLTRNH